MMQSRERTDSYAKMGGRFVQKFHFLCISSGSPEVLRGDLSADGYRNVICSLFEGDPEGARICLTFVGAQAWYVAVQSGLPETVADSLFDVYSQKLRHARTVERILDAYIDLLVSLARKVAVLRQPRVRDDRIQQAIDYINDHICEPITAGQVASSLGLTQSYLSRAFKEKVGKTLVAYIQETKVQNAGVLLRNQELSVSDVMDRLGYVSQSHFTKIFREHTGMTPARYRRQGTTEFAPEYFEDQAWQIRLDIYQKSERYRREKGAELQNYFLACVRRGNVSALEKELKDPGLYTQLYALLGGRLDVAIETFLSTWPQVMHAAGDSGVSVEKAVETFAAYVMRLYGCDGVNEVLDLNCEYMLCMARLVWELP